MTLTYGTLSNVAGFPVAVRLDRRGESSDRAAGFVASRTLRENVSRQTDRPENRIWHLTFGPDGRAALLTAWAAAKGGALPLSWTPPPPDDGAAIPVRFVSGTLRMVQGPGPELFEAEVELEEVA